MIQGMQYRVQVNLGEWGEWQWLPDNIAWSGVEWRFFKIEFRWKEVPLIDPIFTRDRAS